MSRPATEAPLPRIHTKKAAMVGWYNPIQLLQMAGRLLLTNISSWQAPPRSQTRQDESAPYIDYRSGGAALEQPFWFDFVADCGDGWNSTFSVASCIAQDSLQVEDPHGRDSTLPRSDLLVFGGDLVYPLASRQGYETRLIRPYTDALWRIPEPRPDVLAIPGNHDWYDGLVWFRRLFCCGGTFGAWQTRQTESYFAARLPHGWWLVGVDTHLSHDIDGRQARDLERLLEGIDAGEGIILCSPEPTWLDRRSSSHGSIPTRLENLIDRLKAKHRLLRLAGDHHHYQRYSKDQDHRVVCGTGGAFTHPTHLSSDQALAGGHTHRCSFPERRTSRRLSWSNLFFLFHNPRFGLLSAPIYLLLSWVGGSHLGRRSGQIDLPEMGHIPFTHPWEAAVGVLHSSLLSPVALLLYLLTLGGCIYLADRDSRPFRWIAGTLHGLTHILAAFLIYWICCRSALLLLDLQPKSIAFYGVTGALMVPLSWGLSSIIMGLYLLLSVNLLQKHFNEAFSSLKGQHWKGFLRFKIEPSGRLTGHFLGIDRVPLSWQKSPPDGQGPRWRPAAGRGIACRLVDLFGVDLK